MTRKNTTAAAPARRSSLLAPPPEPEPRMGTGLAAAIYLALALVYFLPAFLPGKQVYGTDFSNAGFAFQSFISRSFAAGHLPQWVPWVYGGVPYFANPGSAYYPVRFLADWLLPMQGILPAIFLVQFFLAGWGMYLLAREMGTRPWVAFVAGLAFQWTGILTSWVYAGHDGRIIVLSLVPLLFFFLHRGIRTAAVAPFAGAAAAIGFALLSFQIQVAWYMLVGALIWAVFCLVHFGTIRRGPVLAKVVLLGVGAVAFGFAMGAVNFLPFTSYVSHSPRAGSQGRGYEYSVSYSMPPVNVVGMAVPEQLGLSVVDPNDGQPAFPAYHGENGFKLHSEYVGAVALVLFALGFWYARRNRHWWLFAGSGFFFLTMAFGGHTPLYRLYWALLPGMKKFRAPDLAYGMVAFSLVAMGALALEMLARARDAAADRKAPADTRDRLDLVPWIGGAVVAIAFLGAAALGSHPGQPGEPSAAPGWMRFAVFAAGATVALWAWTSRRIGPAAAMWILAAVTTADLWMLGKKFFYTVPAPAEYYAEDDVAGFFKTQQQAGPFRVWPLGQQSPWPRVMNYPMYLGIDQAGGEHGNQLQRYNEYVGAGAGTTPDFHNFQDSRFINADNVRYIVGPPGIAVDFLKPVFQGQQATVYENVNALPRAWVVGQATRAGAGQTLLAMQQPAWDPRTTAVVESPRDLALGGARVRGAARVVSDEPDRVAIDAQSSGAGLLVLADNWYPDWKATVDGRPAEIYRTNHTFRGVVIPAGQHRVVFTFDSASLHTGFLVWLATLVLLAAYGVWLLVSWRRNRGDTVDAAAADPAPAG